MSLSNAESYARKAKLADDASEVGEYAEKAIRELISTIRTLESKVSNLESQFSRIRR